MDVSEIPEDIRKAALKVVDRGYNEGLIDAVAAALMAEREQCAEICDAFADREDALALIKPPGDTPLYRHGEKIAKELAHAIRP